MHVLCVNSLYLFQFKLCSFIEVNSEVFGAALEQNLLAAENKVCLHDFFIYLFFYRYTMFSCK